MTNYEKFQLSIFRMKEGKFFTKEKNFAFDGGPASNLKLESNIEFLDLPPFNLGEKVELKLLRVGIGNTPFLLDYAYAIASSTDMMAFYFIDKIDRVSDDVIRLYMTFDVINTLFAAFPTLVLFDPRTRVLREHKSRFELSPSGKSWIPKIDRFPEGITGEFYRTAKERIELDKLDWTEFFFSDGTDASSPISTCLVPSEPLTQKVMKAEEDNLSVNVSTGYPNSSSIYFCLCEASSRKVSFNQVAAPNTRVVTLGETAQIDGRDCIVLAARIWYRYDSASSTSGAYLYKLWYDLNGLFVKEEQVGAIENLLNYITAPKCARVYSSASAWPTSLASILRLPTLPTFYKKDIQATEKIISEMEVDRTSLGLRKAICLPYRPFDRDAPGYLPEGIYVSQGKYLIVDANLESTISWTPKGRDFILPQITTKPTESDNGKAAALQLETKIYHSDFQFAKIVYDSFSVVLNPEESYFSSNITENGVTSVTFKFFASPSMVSEFDFEVFSWPGWNATEHIISPKWKEDYPLHLIINRNNETPVYQSGYLDYLRSGYNYDLKSQAVGLWMQGIGIALNAINAGIGIAATAASGGVLAPYAATSVVGFAGSIANFGKTAAENDRGNAQKLKELQIQGASVSGNSDFEVSRRYTKNRVAVEKYQVEPRVIEFARNLFYLKGYATDEYKAPTMNNRKHFDFLQCEPVFNPIIESQFQPWAVDLARAAFREGVTVFHQVNEAYDLLQQSSNFENEILNTNLAS